jgi:hypothetical protein
MPWNTFLAAHWEGLAAADFFTVEVLTLFGLVRYIVFFVMKLKTRTVKIAGITSEPDGEWMTQLARNLTEPSEGFLRGVQHIIVDRDPVPASKISAVGEPRPPTSSTRPSARPVAAPQSWLPFKLPDTVHVPLFGSYSSELCDAKPPPPAATMTRPSVNGVALGLTRAMFNGPVGVHSPSAFAMMHAPNSARAGIYRFLDRSIIGTSRRASLTSDLTGGVRQQHACRGGEC